MKFSHAASLKSFGDIGHDRDGGSLDLIGQAKVSGKGLLLCDFVDAFREQASFLPRDQIFESFYRAHDPSSIALRTQNSALSTLLDQAERDKEYERGLGHGFALMAEEKTQERDRTEKRHFRDYFVAPGLLDAGQNHGFSVFYFHLAD